jgi:hypothetical protein
VVVALRVDTPGIEMIQGMPAEGNAAILVIDGFESGWPRGGKTKPAMGYPSAIVICLCLVVSSVSLYRAQDSTLKYEADHSLMPNRLFCRASRHER